jgi:hypothetical protein
MHPWHNLDCARTCLSWILAADEGTVIARLLECDLQQRLGRAGTSYVSCDNISLQRAAATQTLFPSAPHENIMHDGLSSLPLIVFIKQSPPAGFALLHNHAIKLRSLEPYPMHHNKVSAKGP